MDNSDSAGRLGLKLDGPRPTSLNQIGMHKQIRKDNVFCKKTVSSYGILTS
jgi:hypothetical protein